MAVRIGNIEIDWVKVLLALLFLLGLGVFMYPFVNNWMYQSEADTRMQAYERAVAEQEAKDAKKYDDAFADARKYNETLVGQVVPDVFAIREGTTDKDYESRLNITGDQMMGSIEIPAINVNLPIYHYSTKETLEKGCGHIFGSSLPVGGKSSHSVITAHRGLPTAEMFSDLDQLRKGDKFYLHILNRTLAYEIDGIEVVKPNETRSLAIDAGEDLCTLVTCTPYGVNTERLLVHGHSVPYVAGDENQATDFRLLGLFTKLFVGLAGVLLAVVLLWVYSRWRKKRAADTAGVIDGAALDGCGLTDTQSVATAADDLDKRIARARHRA